MNAAPIAMRFLYVIPVVVGIGLLLGWSMLAVRKQETVQINGSLGAQQLQNVLDRQKVEITLGGAPLTVEVVNTAESITQGLSGRTEIGADGMLFVFPNTVETGFWMKEMRFDLDIVWIADGTVISVLPNVPRPTPGQALSELPTYRPDQPFDMVLELPAGQAEELSVARGAIIELYSEE